MSPGANTSLNQGGVDRHRSLLNLGPNTDISVNLAIDPDVDWDLVIGWEKGENGSQSQHQ
jgi:hypothetical protein